MARLLRERGIRVSHVTIAKDYSDLARNDCLPAHEPCPVETVLTSAESASSSLDRCMFGPFATISRNKRLSSGFPATTGGPDLTDLLQTVGPHLVG